MLARMKLNRPRLLRAARFSRVVRLGGALLLALVLGVGARSAMAQTSPETKDDPARRRALLEELRRLLPKSEPWEKWLAASGELPPDFEKLPGMAFLPGPMKFADGHLVRTPEQWPARRTEILQLCQRYIIGSVPPPPGNVKVGSMKTRTEDGVTIQEIVLEFGPEGRGRLNVELMIPPGEGRFPVFITQDNHRRWALIAASRGYIGCVYAGADSRDDTEAFIPLYPQHDWGKLARRAWAASRCIDYLVTLPGVDATKIALTGHSRNGKLALIAAALDERITATISSSAGAGGPCPWRYFSEAQFGEGIELMTRAFPDWFHPRLRFFAGRENKLPVDQNSLLACIAPRACLISTAHNDAVESVWAVEQSIYSAREAYSLLGEHHGLRLRYRAGGHETRAEDIESYVDWLDTVFGRSALNPGEEPMLPTHLEWVMSKPGREFDPKLLPLRGVDNPLEPPGQPTFITTAPEWTKRREELKRQVRWVLGDAPPRVVSQPGEYGKEVPATATLLRRATVPADLGRQSLNFGNYINGDLYFPAGADQGGKKLATIIWLHPMNPAGGYYPSYRRGDPPHVTLAKAGFAVLAFDQIGQGYRVPEAAGFYGRYPNWSLLGKTVQDIQAAVDALERTALVDAKRIYLVGYGTGAMAALHAAALDDRIAGVVSVAGFTPMRLDNNERSTGGVARWAQWTMLLPRLGGFVGNEARIPYDYHEVLALLAPRPVLVAAPRVDYQANLDDVRACVGEARKVYSLLGQEGRLDFAEMDTYNHFDATVQQQVIERFKRLIEP